VAFLRVGPISNQRALPRKFLMVFGRHCLTAHPISVNACHQSCDKQGGVGCHVASLSNHILASFFHTLPLGVGRSGTTARGATQCPAVWAGTLSLKQSLLGPRGSCPCSAEHGKCWAENHRVWLGDPRDQGLDYSWWQAWGRSSGTP
jgi:hypothetical protein